MGLKELFRGSSTAHGQTLQDGTPKGSPRTVVGPIPDEAWDRHIRGEVRLGVVPTDEHGQSWCGAVDVDKHDGSGVDLLGLSAQLGRAGLPGIVCRTRRGGAHIWFFMAEPVNTRLLIKFLERVAALVRTFGDPIEVFPKQPMVGLDSKGSWIHLPYCGDTSYAVGMDGGIQPLDLEEFLALAESKRVTTEDLQHAMKLPETTAVDYSQGPPCLERLAQDGVAEGGRSNALVNFGIFFQRAGLNVYEELTNVNATLISPPMPKSGIRELAQRVTRNAYNYTCSATPICDLCDKEECIRRAWGVASKSTADTAEVFRGLTKIDFEASPLFQLKIRNRVVELDAEGLMSWRVVRASALKATNELLPVMKDGQWESILRPLLENMTVQKPPMGSSPSAMVRDLIERFVTPAQEKVRTGMRHQHSDVMFAMPVVLEDHHGLRIAFRPEDLLMAAKRRKIQLDPGTAWVIASQMGFEADTVNVGGRTVEIWWKGTEPTPQIEFTPAMGQEEF